MATARINVFCTTEELSNWLAIIVSKYQLHSIWFTLQDDYSKQLNILTEKNSCCSTSNLSYAIQ